MARPSATDQLNRILAIVPWIAERDAPLLSEVCERFSLTRDELLADLAVVPMVGLYPYTPDNLIELIVDDDRVSIDYGNFFERPLRLSKEEGLAIVAAGMASAEQVGHDPEGPLSRGLAKIARVLGIDVDDDLAVGLDAPPGQTMDALDRAIRERHVLRLGYFSHARNEHTDRTIEPLRLFHTEGAWYVDAYCRTSQDHRVFRVDRITDLEVTDEVFEPRDGRATPSAFDPDAELPRVTIEVDAEGTWVGERYPVEERVDLPDGGQRLTLAVSARPWLERLLLRLGPHGHVVSVSGDPDLADAGVAAARRLLGRYGEG